MMASKLAKRRFIASMAVPPAESSRTSSSVSPPPRKRRKTAEVPVEASPSKPDCPDEPSSSKQKQKQKQKKDVTSALESLEEDYMHPSWYAALKDEFAKPYFRNLKQFLNAEHQEHTIFPALQDIYNWSRLTPLDAVKIVVIGQDPYHNVNQAHGLAFSVLPPTKPPPSLKNIYKQIQTDIPAFRIPTHGDLTPLATRGVLFLNPTLTVRAHKANSHAGKGWEQLTTAALRAIAQRAEGRGVVFFAWGLPAQKTCKAVGIDETKHLVLRSAHPSPLSAYRGFFGNGHFKRANEWLEEKYGTGEGIDWAALHD